MWSANEPGVEVVEVVDGVATLRVRYDMLTEFDSEGFPLGVEDYDRRQNWALVLFPADEVEGLQVAS